MRNARKSESCYKRGEWNELVGPWQFFVFLHYKNKTWSDAYAKHEIKNETPKQQVNKLRRKRERKWNWEESGATKIPFAFLRS